MADITFTQRLEQNDIVQGPRTQSLTWVTFESSSAASRLAQQQAAGLAVDLGLQLTHPDMECKHLSHFNL